MSYKVHNEARKSVVDFPRGGQASPGLEGLLFPISDEQFFGIYWEKQVLHISRNTPDYFSDLGVNLSIENIIHLQCPQWGDVSLARAGTNPADCPYISEPPSLRSVERAFADNYTVVVNDLQKKDIAVANLCRQIEAAFFSRANVNLYLTNKASQGLNAHYDDDDVFVLQLRGEKTWKTYETRALLPLPNSPYQKIDISNDQYRTYILEPGDVLYVPRGVFHEAESRDAASLHLTISINVLRWETIFRTWIGVIAESEPGLRKSIPAGVLRNRQFQHAAFPLSILEQALNNRAYFERALGRVQDQLLDSMDRLPRHCFGAVPDPLEVDERTVLKISTDQAYCLDESDGSCVLKGVLTNVRFPPDMQELAVFICDTREFSAEQMPARFPLQERLKIVRRLFESGFLVK